MSDQEEQQRTNRRQFQLAFVLDIDGCLSREGVLITGAATALKRLRDHNFPFIFCTNDDTQLKKRVRWNYPRPSESMSTRKASSSFRTIAATNGDRTSIERSSFGGGRGVRRSRADVWRRASASMERVIRPFFRAWYADPVAVDDSVDPVAAVMFFEDPKDLGEVLQLALDVFLTNGDPSGPRVLLEHLEVTQKVEFWFTNPDLSYSGLAVRPRITQGSYRLCLEALFRSATSKSGQEREVIAQTVGKPSRLTGETARSKLLEQCPEGTVEDDLEIWTVGDNPLSDVALAHIMGWKSALVKTGIWDGSMEPEFEHTIRTDSFAVLLDELMPTTSLSNGKKSQLNVENKLSDGSLHQNVIR